MLKYNAMIKVKQLFGRHENYGTSNHKYIHLDEVINQFIQENNIKDNKLIDIKYAPVGYFQEGNGEGELEVSALIIYRK